MAAGSRLAGQAVVQITGDDADLRRKIQSATQSLSGFCDFAGEMGSRMKAAGSAMFNVFLDSAKIFAGFDTQMRTVKAVTGATGKEFDALTKKAKDLGATTSFSASQVAEGMAALGRMGFSSREIEASIGDMLNLSLATGTALGDTAEIAANQLRVFGMDASEMTKVADIMSYTANASAQTLTDLGEALKMAGPTAAQAGLSLKDVSAQLGVLANMGLRGSQAGTSLARAYKQIADPKIQEYLQGLGVAVRDANGLRSMTDIFADLGRAMAAMGNDERIAAFDKIFQSAGSLAGGALTINVDGINALMRGLDKAKGYTEKTAKSIDSGLEGAFNAFYSAVEAVKIALGDAFGDTLKDVLSYIANFCMLVQNAVEDNKGLASILGKIAMGLAAVGSVLATLTTISAAYRTVKAALLFLETATAPAQVATTAATVAQTGATVGLTAATGAATTATGAFSGILHALCAHPIIAVMTALAGVLVMVAMSFKQASNEAARLAKMRFEALDNFRDKTVEQDKDKLHKDSLNWTRLRELSAKAEYNGLDDSELKEAKALAGRLEGRGYRVPTMISATGFNMKGWDEAYDAGYALNRRKNIGTELDLIAKEYTRLSEALGTGGLTTEQKNSLTTQRDALNRRREELQTQYKQVELETQQARMKQRQAELAKYTAELNKNAGEAAKIEEDMRNQALSEEERKLADIEKRQKAYNKAMEFQLLTAQGSGKAELERRQAETNALFDSERRKVTAGMFSVEADMEERRARRAEEDRKDNETRRLDNLKNSDPKAYVEELRKMMAETNARMQQAAQNYRDVLANAKAADSAGGELVTEDERSVLEEAKKTYEAMQDEMDSVAGRLRDGVAAAEEKAGDDIKSWGGFNSDIFSMIGEVNLQRKTETNTRNTAKYTKDILDNVKNGGLQATFA